MIEPIYESFNVIDAVAAEGTCVSLTEDNEVFAVLGGFLGPVATANQCIVTLNETILIGGELTDEEIEAARAPYYGSATGATGPLLLDVLQAEGLADGAEVFVMNGGASIDSGPDAIGELEDRGITVVGSGNIEAGPGDIVAQDAEVQVLTEQIRASGANTVFIRGNTTAAVRGLAAVGLTDELAMWVTDSSELEELGDTIPDRSVADGALALAAATAAETFELDRFQACVAAVETAVPAADIRLLDDYTEDDENWYWPTLQACDAIATFADIATAAGPELTHESFVSGADSLTEFDLPECAVLVAWPRKGQCERHDPPGRVRPHVRGRWPRAGDRPSRHDGPCRLSPDDRGARPPER